MTPEVNTKLKKSFVDEMQFRILSGQLRPGDRLPAERDLALEMGISRTSVNQGILDLERLGFLRIVPRRGTYVADYINNATALTLAAIMQYDATKIEPKLFRDFMEFRILVERECVRLACERMDDDAQQKLQAVLKRLQNEDGGQLVEAVYEFHRLLTLLSGNGAYAIAFRSFGQLIRNMTTIRYNNREEFSKSLPLYERLIGALCCGDSIEADLCLSELLKKALVYLDTLLRERI